jgi:hypothetical protein
MKKIIYIWLASIVGLLLGGFLLCVPQILPFAITLTALSGVLFIFTGILAILIFADAL